LISYSEPDQNWRIHPDPEWEIHPLRIRMEYPIPNQIRTGEFTWIYFSIFDLVLIQIVHLDLEWVIYPIRIRVEYPIPNQIRTGEMDQINFLVLIRF